MVNVAAARQVLDRLAKDEKLAPHFVRLALHDALTYDAVTKTGGANGSIRVERELQHPGNEGLAEVLQKLDAVKGQLDPISYADLIQLAGHVGLEAMHGPKVTFRPGRQDSRVSPPRGRLPLASAHDNFKMLMARTGLLPRHFVALAGYHPFGVMWSDPQKVEGAWDPRLSSFDNTFFKALVMPNAPHVNAPACLMNDPELKRWVLIFARDQDAWVEAYAEAFAAASLLGTGLAPGLKGPEGPPAGASSSGARTNTASQSSTLLQVSQSQLAAAAVAVAVVAGAVGYWVGNRRRKRFL